MIIISLALIYIIICSYYYPYICENAEACSLLNIISYQPFAVASDGILSLILLGLIFAVQRSVVPKKIYYYLLFGFSFLFFQLITDTLDEVIRMPLLHSIIFENLFQLIGCALVSFGIIRWFKLHEDKNLSLEALTRIDSLTKIANRRAFLQDFEREKNRAIRYQLPLSLMVIDVNKFKLINDTYGHLCGDQVLVYFADLIKKNIRRGDCFCRWGGDEFMVLLIHTNLGNAKIVRTKLQRTIEKSKINYEGKTIHFSASIGIATLKDSDRVEDIISRADADMYLIKREKTLNEFIER